MSKLLKCPVCKQTKPVREDAKVCSSNCRVKQWREDMKNFSVLVTVVNKKDKVIPLWNKVRLTLAGDKRNLIVLMAQLDLVKADVNRDMNQKGLALKDVDISIDFEPRA